MAFSDGINDTSMNFYDWEHAYQYDGLGYVYEEDAQNSTAPYNRQEDRISDMPDEILLHILSFMDMKQVIPTRRLSKRWYPLWRNVPVLNFDMSLFGSNNTISARFIDKILLYRHKDSDIQRFCLSSSRIGLSDFEDWMKFVLSRHVQELEVHYTAPYSGHRYNYIGLTSYVRPPVERNLSLPKCIFTSGIRVFKLHAAQIPPQINLANQLQTLELYSSSFVQTRNVEVNCPVLENLIMRNCEYSGVLNIRSPLLQNIFIEQSPSNRKRYCCLKLSAPALKSLRLKGVLFTDYALTNLQSLVNSDVEINDPVDARVLIKLLNGLHNATTLKLSLHSVMVPWFFSVLSVNHFFLPFDNLRHFKLFAYVESSCANIIHNMLTSSTSISVETIDIGTSQIISKEKNVKELFQCFSGLKSMKIHGVQGKESELKFLEFVLKTAGVLETLTVTTDEMFSWNTSEGEQADFYTKIYSFPRAPGAKILVRMPSPRNGLAPSSQQLQRQLPPVPPQLYGPPPPHHYQPQPMPYYHPLGPNFAHHTW